MSREKQIEEMASILLRLDDCEKYDEIKCVEDCKKCRATQIYNAGYRKQEWISVDERLPEPYVLVVVFIPSKAGVNRFQLDRLSSAYYWTSHTYDGVTHWMPLPEAPKMKGGAE